MAIDKPRRQLLGNLVTRSQKTGSLVTGNPALIDEEIRALHELLSLDLSQEVREELKMYYSWGNWYLDYWGPYAGFWQDWSEWKIGVSVGESTIYLVYPPDGGSHYVKLLGPGIGKDLTTGLLAEIAGERKTGVRPSEYRCGPN